MTNRKLWAGLLLILVWSLFVVDFRSQVSINDTFLHLITINLFLILLIHPPEEFITALDFSFEGVIKCFRIKREFLEYACYRILCYQCALFLFPLANAGYFLHGQIFMKGSGRRFHPSFDHPRLYATVFLSSLLGMIFYYYANSNFKKWKIFKDIQEIRENGVNAPNFRFDIRNAYMINISKTLNKSICMDDQYFLYVTNFSLVVSPISDVTITVVGVQMQTLREEDQDERNQIIKVIITFANESISPITLALRGATFQEVYNQHVVRITVPNHIQLQPNVSDRFVVAFTSRVKENQIFRGKEELESCFGCGGNGEQVVLRKRCDNTGEDVYENVVGDIVSIPGCEECRCKPMWCVSCMARVFLAKQPKLEKHRWLQGVGNCPTCRKTFCVNDVQLFENII